MEEKLPGPLISTKLWPVLGLLVLLKAGLALYSNSPALLALAGISAAGLLSVGWCRLSLLCAKDNEGQIAAHWKKMHLSLAGCALPLIALSLLMLWSAGSRIASGGANPFPHVAVIAVVGLLLLELIMLAINNKCVAVDVSGTAALLKRDIVLLFIAAAALLAAGYSEPLTAAAFSLLLLLQGIELLHNALGAAAGLQEKNYRSFLH